MTHKLAAGESIVIDGKLDDPAWEDAEWTYDMIDITRHKNQQLNAIPNDLQARVKIRWDDDFFYVGAVLHESYVTAKNVGHNNHAPYSPDNDFEIFIDVSGTTQYYMEYEMSAQNATYDIKWGKPDGTSLACDNSGGSSSWPALPTCVNTSFGGYAGNWTMATKYHPGPMADRLDNFTKPALMNGSLTDGKRGTTAWPVAADDTGMLSATAWVGDDYERYRYQTDGGWDSGRLGQWSAEIRFPIRQTPGYWTQGGGYPTSHGGLTDADPVRQKEWDQYDPSRGDAGPGRPRYWWVNFARAEHPKTYTMADGRSFVCPKNCTAELEHAVNVTDGAGGPGHPSPKTTWPTILGSYWEWVWGPVGDAHPGVGYMHRPSSFPLVQFADASRKEPLCRHIEFPGRHVAKSLHLAQAQYARYHNGSYATAVATLLNASLCNLDLTTSDTCDLDALEFAVAHPEVFQLGMSVTESISAITRACPTRPCYMASVRVTVPTTTTTITTTTTAAAKPYVYTAFINSNRDTTVRHEMPSQVAPCL